MSTPAIKRQRKRKRLDTDGDPEFQVAPMVDVLLVLMLFFMAITSTEVLKKNKNLQLADANHAKPSDKADHKHEIVVNVEWNGANSAARFTLDDVTSDTADGLQSVLAARHNADPAAYVVVRADRDVEYSNVSDLMTVCGNVGIASVSFAVLLNNNKPGAPAAAAPAASQ